jgi:hypothetical protein
VRRHAHEGRPSSTTEEAHMLMFNDLHLVNAHQQV